MHKTEVTLTFSVPTNEATFRDRTAGADERQGLARLSQFFQGAAGGAHEVHGLKVSCKESEAKPAARAKVAGDEAKPKPKPDPVKEARAKGREAQREAQAASKKKAAKRGK